MQDFFGRHVSICSVSCCLSALVMLENPMLFLELQKLASSLKEGGNTFCMAKCEIRIFDWVRGCGGGEVDREGAAGVKRVVPASMLITSPFHDGR